MRRRISEVRQWRTGMGNKRKSFSGGQFVLHIGSSASTGISTLWGGLNRYPIPPNGLLNLSWQRHDGRDVGLRLSTPRATPLSAMVGLYNVGSNLEPKSYVATVITKD
jgi:hypothetical protein